MNYKDFFRGKRVAVVGTGEHGAMLADVRFLMKLKVRLSIYDLRSRDKLGGSHHGSIAQEIESICTGAMVGAPASCHFGILSLMADTKSRDSLSKELAENDIIILAPDIPRDSSFLRFAADAGVRIEYADVLLFKLIPSTMLVGVMGSAGKSAVARMIYAILENSDGAALLRESIVTESLGITEVSDDKADEDADTVEINQPTKRSVFFADPEIGGVLSHLKKVKKDDIIIARMPEHMMDEYRLARITPHVAVLTHVSKSLAQMGTAFFGVLEFQTYNSFIVASDIAIDMLKKYGEFQPRAKMLRTMSSTIPSDWNIDIQNTHVRENTALAVETAKIFKIDPDAIHLALTQMKPMKGRIERLKSVKGQISFYNDTMSIRPEATLAALRALGESDSGDVQNHRGIVLVIGGAYTGASYKDLFAEIPQYVSSVIVLPGSGTLTERAGIEGLKEKDVKVLYVKNLIEAAENIKFLASKGDAVLFSPGFDITGQYESRQARGEEFIEAVKAAK
ncbi:MAG: hypothetical protein RIT04_124 [Candidatus Parcubacteria bacterium]|jgi:UDP-N-acetylmuramoylalanine--D-glutamate ligase